MFFYAFVCNDKKWIFYYKQVDIIDFSNKDEGV